MVAWSQPTCRRRTAGRTTGIARALAALATVLAVAVALVPERAEAACPAVPAALTTIDRQEGELRELRRENATACEETIAWSKTATVTQLAMGSALLTLLSALAVVKFFRKGS